MACVGAEVVRLLHEQADDLPARIGAPLELVGVAVRRPGRDRGRPADRSGTVHHGRARPGRSATTSTWWSRSSAASSRPGPGCVEALRAGKSVVTANKALLAEDGATLHDAAAEKAAADLYYEAAVAGADPARCGRCAESLARRPHHPGASASSTAPPTSSSTSDGQPPAPSFAEALEEATALGYAEADPTADVEGFDAAAKAAILASLAFHTRVAAADVHREGITEVTAADIALGQGDGLHGRQAAGASP